MSILGVTLSSIFSIIALFIRWKIAKSKEQKISLEVVEKENQSLNNQIESLYEIDKDHSEKLIEIAGDSVSDDRASQLLSRPIVYTKVSNSPTTKLGASGNKKLH